MRVLQLIPGLSYSSGPTHIVHKIAEQLVDQGCDVSICYLTSRGMDTVLPEDSKIKTFAYDSKGSPRYGYSPAMRKGLADILKDFDVVHSHALWMYPNLALYHAARLNNVPYIIAPQGSLDVWSLQQNSIVKRIYGALIERKVLNNAAAIQAVSEYEKGNIRDFGVSTPIEVVPNGVSLETFQDLPSREQARAALNIDSDSLVLLFLGRIHSKKGLDVLIPTVSGLVKKHPKLLLVIAGSDGNSGYQHELDAMISRHELTDRVKLLGEVKDQEKLTAFACADMFTLTSHSEGLPVAAVEAMACGLPAVITPGCHIPDVKKYGAGLITKCNSSAAAEAIQTILDDYELRGKMAKAARQLIEENFQWSQITAKLIELYHRVSSEKL
ncbi:hypothetical protein BVX94_00590 [bacterium B17]|nr:hypothetical protein BVX94_00590 [bacterium B17]